MTIGDAHGLSENAISPVLSKPLCNSSNSAATCSYELSPPSSVSSEVSTCITETNVCSRTSIELLGEASINVDTAIGAHGEQPGGLLPVVAPQATPSRTAPLTTLVASLGGAVSITPAVGGLEIPTDTIPS
ncbi:unnamed protein product [Phytophthora fragariaefolia]|uniref:Unnamed protein product n=1 Tax=Phytophthora fragariaefolia TaxID=1490495 RepID=A0A9W6WYI7_9STRA|nr:unnamed protein product [Phytophthora fragariaefolia]